MIDFKWQKKFAFLSFLFLHSQGQLFTHEDLKKYMREFRTSSRLLSRGRQAQLRHNRYVSAFGRLRIGHRRVVA